MKRRRKRRSTADNQYDDLCRAMVRNNALHLSLRTRLLIQAQALEEVASAPTLEVARGLAAAALEEVADIEWEIRKKICLGEPS